MNVETIILGVLQMASGVALWFMKDTYGDLKARLLKLEETTVRKDDFKDFKQELFKYLDDLRQEIRQKHE